MWGTQNLLDWGTGLDWGRGHPLDWLDRSWLSETTLWWGKGGRGVPPIPLHIGQPCNKRGGRIHAVIQSLKYPTLKIEKILEEQHHETMTHPGNSNRYYRYQYWCSALVNHTDILLTLIMKQGNFSLTDTCLIILTEIGLKHYTDTNKVYWYWYLCNTSNVARHHSPFD